MVWEGGGVHPANHLLFLLLLSFNWGLFPQKSDKWAKMMSQDENSLLLTEFLEKGESQLLIIYSNPQGQLTPITTYPPTMKAKVSSAIANSFWGNVLDHSVVGNDQSICDRYF